jgi:hypothetical protein
LTASLFETSTKSPSPLPPTWLIMFSVCCSPSLRGRRKKSWVPTHNCKILIRLFCKKYVREDSFKSWVSESKKNESVGKGWKWNHRVQMWRHKKSWPVKRQYWCH